MVKDANTRLALFSLIPLIAFFIISIVVLLQYVSGVADVLIVTGNAAFVIVRNTMLLPLFCSKNNPTDHLRRSMRLSVGFVAYCWNGITGDRVYGVSQQRRVARENQAPGLQSAEFLLFCSDDSEWYSYGQREPWRFPAHFRLVPQI